MSKTTKTVILAVLSVLYIAGIVSFFFNFGLGLILWAAALLPSLVLYLYQKHIEQLELEKKLENAEKAEKTEE